MSAVPKIYTDRGNEGRRSRAGERVDVRDYLVAQ